MSITRYKGKRGTTYHVRIWHDGRNHHVCSAPSLKAAKLAEAEALRTAKRVRRDGLTLAGFCAPWLADLHRETSTLDDYERSVNRAIDILGDRPLDSVDDSVMDALVRGLMECGYAPWTVHKTVQHFRAMLKAASRKGLCDAPPIPASLPKVEREPVEPLSREKVRELIDAAPDYWKPLFLLAATSGLRRAELFALTVDDFDPEAGTVRVRKSKTPAGRRLVHLPDETVAALKAHTPPANPERLLFPTPRGARVHFSNWNARVGTPTFAAVGLEGQGLHSLRHTYASVLIASGNSAKVVQVMLGHKDVTTTLNVYGHLFPDAWGAAAKAVGEWYDRTKSPAKVSTE